ncbi:Uncharacterised protein [Mycobacteroides abscessus subsp. abscessus]|nr:Uncharacterised protein [Mycobacteroides abscessus subsp. abscessus]
MLPLNSACCTVASSGMLEGTWWSMNPAIRPSSKYGFTACNAGFSLSSAPMTEGTMFWDAANSAITSLLNMKRTNRSASSRCGVSLAMVTVTSTPVTRRRSSGMPLSAG